MRRGEVWWAAFDPAVGSEIRKTRPAVIISADDIIKVRRTLIVVPLSTGPAPRPPINVPMRSVALTSVAVCDQARCLDKSRLTRLIAQLDTHDLALLEESMRQILKL
jgi:mRNA interferase MazF